MRNILGCTDLVYETWKERKKKKNRTEQKKESAQQINATFKVQTTLLKINIESDNKIPKNTDFTREQRANV